MLPTTKADKVKESDVADKKASPSKLKETRRGVRWEDNATADNDKGV